MKLMWICLGGAVGTGFRHLLAHWVQGAMGGRWPLGTLAVNALGSFAMGVISQLSAGGWIPPAMRPVLVFGLLGGFTTYSSFNQEALDLLQRRGFLVGGMYMGLMVATCLAAGLLGLALARGVR
jgi:CrcB protein